MAVANGGEDYIEILSPICGQCNKSMGTKNLLDFKREYFGKNVDCGLNSVRTSSVNLIDLVD